MGLSSRRTFVRKVFTVSALIPAAYPRFFVCIITRHVAYDLSALVGTSAPMLDAAQSQASAIDKRRSEAIAETIQRRTFREATRREALDRNYACVDIRK